MKRAIKNLILICWVFLIGKPSFSQESRPNIVVILCDDLGYGDLQCYGHPYIKSPHLDQMAAEGIRFTDFYSTAPVCSPSRVGLLTGRSPNKSGVYDWIPSAKAAKADARDQVHMRREELTIAEMLKKAGYATMLSGKWHCNSRFNSPLQPQPGEAGFDHWFATYNNARPSHKNPNNFVRNGQEVGEITGYSCQIVTQEAIDWITQHKEEEGTKPFFLYMAFHEPHEPVASPEELVAKYRAVARTEEQAEYFANVENIDIAVGKFLGALKDLSIDQNTLVIFTGDNGPETLCRYKGACRSYGVATPLRGMKLWTTDAGFRVPGIIRWPNRIKASQVVHHPVSALDFFPTFCDLAGIELPKGHQLDGVNFLPALEGQALVRKNPLIWAYYWALNSHRVAMREGDWKILGKIDLPKFSNVHSDNIAQVRSAKFIAFELYNIRQDIDENEDLYFRYPNIARRMTKKLKKHYQKLLKGSYVWTVQ